jgi:hypothetical protein
VADTPILRDLNRPFAEDVVGGDDSHDDP